MTLGHEHPHLSPHIRRMKNHGIAALDRDRPDGICGEQFWFEFHDRATAQRFQRDLYAFAEHWEAPEPAGEDAELGGEG